MMLCGVQIMRKSKLTGICALYGGSVFGFSPFENTDYDMFPDFCEI